MVSVKRSKILIALSILVITTFLLFQLISQKVLVVPQLPIASMPINPENEISSIIDGENVHRPENQPTANQQEQIQPDDGSLNDVDKSVSGQPDEPSIAIEPVNTSQIVEANSINEQPVKQESKPEKPEETRIEEVAPTETKIDKPVEIQMEQTKPVEIQMKQTKPVEIKMEESRPAKVAVEEIAENSKDLHSPISESSSKTYTIVLWTPFFERKDYFTWPWKNNCDYTNCRFTSNRTSYHKADALMFHAADINTADIPKSSRDPDQRWIFLNHESPHHVKFKNVDALNDLINWTVTYRLDSDLQLSPTFHPVPSVLPAISVNHDRPKMVSWLVSNCHTPSNREQYVQELKKYIPVDVYGACGNLTCLPKMSDGCYKKLSENYYFYLSFENSICPDYVTEKFFSIINYPIIPVVFGGADYKRSAPPNSYIDALSFDSPEKLAEYLIYLTENPNEYDVYFNWKRFYVQSNTHWGCSICKAFNKADKSRKTWHQLSQWWFKDAPCSRWMNGKVTEWHAVR